MLHKLSSYAFWDVIIFEHHWNTNIIIAIKITNHEIKWGRLRDSQNKGQHFDSTNVKIRDCESSSFDSLKNRIKIERSNQ